MYPANGHFSAGANVPPELDVYRPTAQGVDLLWNSGPNEQFKAMVRQYSNQLDSSGGRTADFLLLQEADTVPQSDL